MVKGDFICLDREGNILLDDAYEEVDANDECEDKRLGQILIVAAQRVAVEVQVRPLKHLIFLAAPCPESCLNL